MADSRTQDMVVALLRRPSDEARLLHDGTYHLQLASAQRVLGVTQIAWYVPGWHPETPYCLRYRGSIVDGWLSTRLAYIPTEPEHPRAHEPYWIVRVVDVVVLDPPLPSARWRRIGVHRYAQHAVERSSDLGQVSRLTATLPDRPTTWEW